MSLTHEQHQALVGLAADKSTAELARAARAEEVRWILLKGPSIARRLYSEDELRPYVDVDVLVAPRDYPRLEAILTGLGYREAAHLPRQRVEHASPWRAPNMVPVDLHRRIPHVAADPDYAWTALSEDTETLRVASEEVEVLGRRALTLLVALHALHHGRSVAKPLQDLEHAAERVPEPAWQDACALAEKLGAERDLAAALTLTPGARLVAGALDLPKVGRWEVALRAGDPARLAAAFRLLRETRGLRAKLDALRGELLPDEAMRQRARGATVDSSATRVLARRFMLVLLAAPGAFLARLLQLNDARRFRRRRTKG